jgi:hypothetical protein
MATQLLDVFPAIVEFGPKCSAQHARVYDTAQIFVSRGNRVELLVEEKQVTSVEGSGSRREPAHVQFADGSSWTIRKAGSCGCGDPLKKFRPATWSA